MMRMTPYKTMLKTKIVKDFLSNEDNIKCVTHETHGYKSIEEFFRKTYEDYKFNGEAWDFDSMDTELFLYNIECDMAAMFDDIALDL